MRTDFEGKLAHLVSEALIEDVGDGDHSSLCCIPPGKMGKAILKIKQDGILAGMAVAEKIFAIVEPTAKLKIFKKDGEAMVFGDIAFEVTASVLTILKCERLVLNSMQRMSGIATLTKQYTDKVKGYKTRILDTRKTTPNFRLLEKEAVKIGGAVNHRFGLYDMIMLKDNHTDMAGGIGQAINRTKEYLRAENKKLRIEVETRNLDEVRQVLEAGDVDVIMLDNMSTDQMKEAIQLIDGRCKTEASGNITEETIRNVANCGVDYISVGALTHSVKSLDLSLKAY